MQHGIKRIIASPGTTNISFVASVQNCPFFEIYSAVDERSAAYMACGLAEESGEPVVLSCTGATASRNYIPGLTEAFYRHLPVLAVTSSQHQGRIGNYVAQVIDRSNQFPDMVKKSIQLYTVHDEEDKQNAITMVNDAILELTNGESGPVHINLFTNYSNNFSVKELPVFRKIERITNQDFPPLPKGRIAIFAGAHQAFSAETTEAIDKFCELNNAVVICDQVSNYQGKYRFMANLVNSQNADLGFKRFDLIIYIGYVHGAYVKFSGKQLWRVNEDGVLRDPYHNLTYVFQMSEYTFFSHYCVGTPKNTIKAECDKAFHLLQQKAPDIPYSNMWIARTISDLIPKGAVLHLSILNTLRAWSYFETNNVLCFSNTGGYGIDGCLSSFIGSAQSNLSVEHFLVIGDLAFFYDVNALMEKLPDNIHILLINNGVGTEFKNYSHRAARFADAADDYIAAKGHNGFKNEEIVYGLCHNMGIKYLSAKDKDEFTMAMNEWLTIGAGPILLEAFTTDSDESDALRSMNTIAKDDTFVGRMKRTKAGKIVKKIVRGR